VVVTCERESARQEVPGLPDPRAWSRRRSEAIRNTEKAGTHQCCFTKAIDTAVRASGFALSWGTQTQVNGVSE
jgi:hypothetical protein